MRKELMDNLNILVVDDEPVCRETLKTLLATQGAAATEAASAEEAERLMAGQAFDAIVTDIRLPGKDGIALLRRIRKRDPELPVIVMTGYSSVGSAVEALKLGAQDYLLKPLHDVDRVMNSIRSAVDRHRLGVLNRRLQEQLRVSEERYRTLFESATDMVFVHGLAASGTPFSILEVNHVACRDLGHDRSAMTGRSFLDLVVPEHAPAAAATLRRLLRETRVSFETLLIDVEERRVPVDVHACLVPLEGRFVVLALARNVSQDRELERKVAEAGETDRRSLGQELHDVLCQDLTSLAMLSSVLQKTIGRANPKAAADARLMHRVARRAVSYGRQLSAGLFPTELDDVGLTSALRHLVDSQRRITKLQIRFTGDPRVKIADRSAELHLYRIAQQAIHNAVTHSGAGRISVDVQTRAGRVVLRIRDNGKGFHGGSRHGMGLHIMRYRARMIHAVLDVASVEKEGTQVTCTWEPERKLARAKRGS